MTSLAPEFIFNRICRPTLSKYVVPGSTPIPFFGNFLNSQVYTIGINPSHKEFLTSTGSLLKASEKRLQDLESLEIEISELPPILRETHAIKVYESCMEYFENNPYHWFNSLENSVNAPFNASYYKGTACHLDLVQWATDPIWSNILKEDSADATYLLESDLPFLLNQISWLKENNSQIKAFVLSGKTVIEALQHVFSLELKGKTQVIDKDSQYSLYIGDLDGISIYGTSMNIADSHTSNSHREFLAKWLSERNSIEKNHEE
jgi:hypothetical protein